MFRRIGILAVLAVLIFPSSEVFAQSVPISPGCRAATQADMKARQDRGIYPLDQQVCPGDVIYLGIGENFDAWFARLKTQSPCNNSSKCTLSCRTRNTGAMVCSATASKWNSIGCHPNNNTAIFPSVAYGFAAHIDLLRKYCGQQGRCTIAQINQKWSTANQSSYAAFVSRMSGIPQNQVFDPNDIDLVARLALSMSCFEAGAMPYNLDDLKQGIAMAGGGAKQPVPSNVGQLLNQSLTGGYAPSANPGTWAPAQFSGQPFMQPQVGYGTNQMQPTSFGTPYNTQQQYNPQTYTNPTPTPSPTPSPDTGTTKPGSPALDIKLWPRTLTRGQTLLVYWTSVNMAKDSCEITYQSNSFAKGNEGLKTLKTTSADIAAMTFTLKCADTNGQSYTATDSVTLQ